MELSLSPATCFGQYLSLGLLVCGICVVFVKFMLRCGMYDSWFFKAS